MKNKSRISATALMAAAGLLSSPAALALGLGDVTVESYIGQPLKARIELITQESDDLASVSARLGSAADYELIGASLDDISVPVRFSVEGAEGSAFLQASSKLPVNNPVVRLIVEVNWASGRMLREYTIFLDPPAVSDMAAPPPRVDMRETAPAVPAQPSPAEPAAAPAEAEPAERSATGAAPVERTRDGEYGPVASGETLWGIASDWARGTGMDVNRVMIAIQRENPEAFLRGNINLLKRGAILRLPTREQVANISRSSAYREVEDQEMEFRGDRRATQPATDAVPLLAEERTAQEPATPAASAEPEAVMPEADEPAVAEDVADPDVAEASPVEPQLAEESAAEMQEPAEARDQLELVPPSEASELESTYGFEESAEDSDTDLSVQALRENLARSEEELITREQQNEYLQNRIMELEAELEAARSAEVADTEMAAMEDRLRGDRLEDQARSVEKPWWERVGVWLISLLVLAAAVAAWMFSSRMREEERVDEDPLREIKDEAEDVLRVLEDSPAPEAGTVAVASAGAVADGKDDEPGKPRESGGDPDEAEVLEAESSDPEIQLDLARAYISMGDKEAASVILEEVVNNGNEEQQAEARKMLDLM